MGGLRNYALEGKDQMHRSHRKTVATLASLIVVAGVSVIGAGGAVASGYYHLWNVSSNKCMDNWSSYTEGTQVRQYNCYSGDQQWWTTIYKAGTDATNHWDVIQNEFSGQCLAVESGKTTTQDEPLVQEPCNDNNMAQNFYTAHASPDGSGWYWSLSATCTVSVCGGGGLGSPTNYLIASSSTANNAAMWITLNKGNPSTAQEWTYGGI
jgi:hypothetical protein